MQEIREQFVEIFVFEFLTILSLATEYDPVDIMYNDSSLPYMVKLTLFTEVFWTAFSRFSR